nr:uncharacterized protein LOC109161700 [Ipomoea batatas]
MAWTGATSTTRPQASTTAPAAPVVAPAVSANAIFDPNDPASPFFLHPNENPSLILVSTALDGRNYHPWARAMEMALLSKNKLGFVDGTVAMPDVSDVKFPYWKRCNNMVSTWITRSLLPEIAQTILWQGTAERIWNTLKSRFSEADIFRVSDLHAEIHQVRQGDLSVGRYFAKLKVLWDELQHGSDAQIPKPPLILPTATHMTEELSLNDPVAHTPSEPNTTVPNNPTTHSQPNETRIPNNPATHSQPNETTVHNSDVLPSVHNEPAVVENQNEIHPQVRRSTRQVSRPAYLQDYDCQLPSTRTSPHTLSAVLSYDKLSPKFKAFALNVLDDMAINRMAASFSSCGNTRWSAKLLLSFFKKSSTPFFAAAALDGADASAVAVTNLHRFFNGTTSPKRGLGGVTIRTNPNYGDIISIISAIVGGGAVAAVISFQGRRY